MAVQRMRLPSGPFPGTPFCGKQPRSDRRPGVFTNAGAAISRGPPNQALSRFYWPSGALSGVVIYGDGRMGRPSTVQIVPLWIVTGSRRAGTFSNSAPSSAIPPPVPLRM